MYSESCYSKPNLDCNYHFPIDLATIGIPIVLNLSENDNYYPNYIWISKIKEIFLGEILSGCDSQLSISMTQSCACIKLYGIHDLKRHIYIHDYVYIYLKRHIYT